MTAKPLQDSHNGAQPQTTGSPWNWLKKNAIIPARRHCWFWIPMVGVTAISAVVSSMFLMGGIITSRTQGQLEFTIALFCTGAVFIIVPPAIALAILRSAVPPPKPGTDSE